MEKIIPSILKKDITLKDIQFNEEDLKNLDKYSCGYNLGDLLELPTLYLKPITVRYWKKKFYINEQKMTMDETRKLIISTYPNSILANYFSEKIPKNESLPNKKRLENALNVYEKKTLDSKYIELCEFIKRDDVLCVHLRCGDTSIDSNYDDTFTEFVTTLSKKFKFTIIFTGIIPGHYNKPECNGLESIRESALKHLHLITKNIENCYILCNGIIDDHLSVFRHSKNIAVHRGGISQILSMICRHNIYANVESGWMSDKFTDKFKTMINCEQLHLIK